MQLIKVLYWKLPTNGKQLPAFPLDVEAWTEPWTQRWEARVLPLCLCGPPICLLSKINRSNTAPLWELLLEKRYLYQGGIKTNDITCQTGTRIKNTEMGFKKECLICQ